MCRPRGRVLPAFLALLAAMSLAAAADSPAGEPDGRCDADRQSRRAAGYRLVPGGHGRWTAANETQRLRLIVSPRGLQIAPPADDRPAWTWGLSIAPGDGACGPAADEEVWSLVTEGRVDLIRSSCPEWFLNGPKGVEHSLSVAAGESGRAEIDFIVEGTLTPKVGDDGRTIMFADPAGAPALLDRELRGLDAEGRDVDVRWERTESPGTGRRVRIVVEGAGHRDPITILSVLVTPKGWAADQGTSPASVTPALLPPASDLCGGAEMIPGTGPFPYLSGTYDLTDATTLNDPPVPSCQANLSRSVWFRFTPAQSAGYTLSLCADAPAGTTVEDTVLAVYEAVGDCAGLTEIAGGCDDDSCAAIDLQSVITDIDLIAGTTYYIVAWKYGATAPAAGSSAIQLWIGRNPPPGPAPANDRCDSAEVIPGAGPFPYLTSLTADISGATTTGDPPAPGCQPNVSRSIWYAFTPAWSGRYTFSACVDGPTGTTVDDTVMAVYAGSGSCSGLSQVAGACDDDSCASEAGQSVIRGVTLTASTTYYVVVWDYGLQAPAAGNTAVQLRVSQELAPANDTCAAAAALALDRPASGTTVNAGNEYQLPSGSTCFSGIGQTLSTASGGDVVYTFTAPASGTYSFRATGYEATRNAVLYVASDCPTGAPPVSVTPCLGAANRNAGYPGEEVECLSLSGGQTVYVYVDENTPTPGSTFAIEATACRLEAEPNDTPAAAGGTACGVEGSVGPAGDVDLFRLGAPPAGSRLFAMLDGVAANSTDFDLRVTTAADTLEYDDLNNDTPFGGVAPNVAGTPLPGAPVFLRVSHYSASTAAEPYRLYAAVQPPASAATRETEPNGTPATATSGAALYFAGALADTNDVDLFAFTAGAGELIEVGIDLDPGRDGAPFNGWLALLDAAGTTLVSVNDGGSTSSAVPGTGSLSATTPSSPGEAIAWRARATGAYYARVAWSSGAPGDYLLSIARDCNTASDGDADGVPDAADCAPFDPAAWAVPDEASGLLFVAGSAGTGLEWSPPAHPGGTEVRYDLVRSTIPGDFTAPACVASDVTAVAAADPTSPGRAFYYLVRAENACGGNLGSRSDGAPRVAGSCP